MGPKRVTKSHIPAINASTRVVVPIDNKRPIKFKMCQKHGRQMGAKDNNP